MSSTFNLKEVFNQYGWDKGFKFEVVYSKSGTVRIYIGERKTSYNVGGYGYDRESAVIAKMINDLIGKQAYDEKVYGSCGGFLSGGTGFSSIKESFESVLYFRKNLAYHRVIASEMPFKTKRL